MGEVAWHAFDELTFDIGRGEKRLGRGVTVGLYGPERSIVDALRLRHREGTHLGREALKRWVNRRGSSVPELVKMSRLIPRGAPAVRRALDALG